MSVLPPLPHTALWDLAAEGYSSPGRCSASPGVQMCVYAPSALDMSLPSQWILMLLHASDVAVGSGGC